MSSQTTDDLRERIQYHESWMKRAQNSGCFPLLAHHAEARASLMEVIRPEIREIGSGDRDME
jgi:hypothetical protein